MKNMRRTKNAQLTVSGVVPAGSLNGGVVILNSLGLKGLMLTPRMTAGMLADLTQTLNHGLKVDEASVTLLGISESAMLSVPGAVALWQAVYKVTADGTYSTSSSGAVKIGYALAAKSADGDIEVALLPST